DARPELLDLLLDVGRPAGGNLAPALGEVLLEGAERIRVILQLVLDLRDVVEDVEVGRELVGAAELDERGLVVAFLEELEALLEALRGLLARGLAGLLRLGDGGRERGGGGDRKTEDQRDAGSFSHWA